MHLFHAQAYPGGTEAQAGHAAEDVSEDEHPALARKVAQEIGMDMFDDTTYQPHRLMYWPSTSSNGEYVFKVMEGDILDPDYYLGLYDDW